MSHISDEINNKRITYSIEGVIHTNFLPLLKGTCYELYKLCYMMEEVYGKELIKLSNVTNCILFR